MPDRSRIAAVLLDVDGTLVASNDQHALAWQAAFREFGYEVDYARLRRMIGMGGDRVLAEIDARLNDHSDPGKAIASRRGAIFRERYLSEVKPTAGARALAERLRARGFKLVVASSAKEDELGALLSVAGVAELIDVRTSSDDAGSSKPAPDIIEVALKKAGVASAEAIMVGDTPYDIEAARRAGVSSVAFRSGGWDDAALAGAIAIYADPADLLARFVESPFA